MLDSSLARLAEATQDDKHAAEVIAFASMTSQFEENLLPSDEAARIAQDHRTGQSEEWTRAVHAALVGLHHLRQEGYSIAKS